MIDASTLSYSSVLMVSGRIPGTYTCGTIRGTSDQDLSSANFSVQGTMSCIYTILLLIDSIDSCQVGNNLAGNKIIIPLL